MKLHLTLVSVFTLVYFCAHSLAFSIRESSDSVIDIPPADLPVSSTLQTQPVLIREKRAMKEDIEKGFKEFSDKVSQLPDQLGNTLKKFFEDRGISVENVQKLLGNIFDSVKKLIDEVKKAM